MNPGRVTGRHGSMIVAPPGDEVVGVRVSAVHHPELVRRTDGRWEVVCPECDRGRDPVPIGIRLPIADVDIAALIRDNHRGVAARRSS